MRRSENCYTMVLPQLYRCFFTGRKLSMSSGA